MYLDKGFRGDDGAPATTELMPSARAPRSYVALLANATLWTAEDGARTTHKRLIARPVHTRHDGASPPSPPASGAASQPSSGTGNGIVRASTHVIGFPSVSNTWLIAAYMAGAPYVAGGGDVMEPLLILFGYLILFILIVAAFGWKLTKGMGYLLLFLQLCYTGWNVGKHFGLFDETLAWLRDFYASHASAVGLN